MADRDRYVDIVTGVLKKLGLLTPTQTMMRVDSLTLFELVTELEAACGFSIDFEELTNESFESIDALVDLLTRVAPTGNEA